jgi:hypothetical protein
MRKRGTDKWFVYTFIADKPVRELKRKIRALTPMALRLAGSGSEAVDLEASGDADDAGLIFAGGVVTGLLGGPWAGPAGSVADEEPRVEDLEQERGQGQVKLVRGESPR